MGKSTLLQRFLDEARIPDLREYCLTALANERQTTPASAMEHFADQFRDLGHPFKKFEEALIQYKEALRRMRATGMSYRDEQELVVREMVDTTGAIMEDLPFAGTVIHKGANTLTDLMLERGYRRQFLKDAARLEDPIGQPFALSNTQDGRHTYHDLARDLFRRHLYQRSPEDYHAARKALADHYQARLAALQSDNARATYKSQPWQELALALIQQLFHLPNEASYLLAIEYILRIKEHSTQDDELIRVLDNFLSDELNQQITVNAQNIVKQLLHYLKEDADDQYQQWFTATNSLLDRILRSPSFSPEALAYLYRKKGRIYIDIKEYQHAVADFSQAITLAPNYVEAYDGRGFTYRLMERYEEALADFNQAIALDEKDAWGIGSRGQAYRAMKRYEEALVEFDRAIALDEKFSWAIASRGQVYQAMGRYEEALADFDRAITLNEKYSWAIANRGETHRQTGRYEEALADFDRAIVLDEKSDWRWYDRSLVYLLTGQLEAFHQDIHIAIDMARAQLEQVAAEDIEYYRIRFNIVLYLLVDGSTELAEAEYSQLMSICPLVSRLRAAAGDLKEFLSVLLSHEPALQMLGRLEARLEEFERSVR